MSATDGVFDNLFQHEVLSMVRDYRKAQPNYLITSEAQAQELAKIMVNAAVDKFKVPKGKKTPYQRKYKKTYNATWEVSKIDNLKVSCIYREAKKTILLFLCLLPEKFAFLVLLKKEKPQKQKLITIKIIKSLQLKPLENITLNENRNMY